MSHRAIQIVLFVAIASSALWSQTALPDPLSGNAMQPTLSTEVHANNTLTTKLRVITEVDDNALNQNTNKITDSINRFDPEFVWNLSRARWSLDTDYTPGVSYSIELPRYRTFTHNLINSLQLMPAKHVTLRFRNTFLRTADPFDTLNPQSNYGPTESANFSYVGLPTLFTREQSGMDLTYQPAAHTTLGLSGSYETSIYDDLVSGASYDRDTRSVSGRAFVDQKLSARQSVSVSYDYAVITSQAFGRTVAQSVLLYDNWQLNPKFNLSVFAGPQYTDVHFGVASAPVPLETGCSWSAGGTLGWHGERTGLTGSLVRRVNDGGGLGGAVEMTSVTAALDRRLTNDWTLSLNSSYTIDGSNSSIGAGQGITYLIASGKISRKIGRSFSIDAQYSYARQDQTSTTLPLGYLADHNRFSVGFSYSFSHRMGM